MTELRLCSRCSTPPRAAREEFDELTGLLAPLAPRTVCAPNRHRVLVVDAAPVSHLATLVEPSSWGVRTAGTELLLARGPYAVAFDQLVQAHHTAAALAGCLLVAHQRWGSCATALDGAGHLTKRTVAKVRTLTAEEPSPAAQVLAQLLRDRSAVPSGPSPELASRATAAHFVAGHLDVATLDELCAAAAAV